MVVKRDRYDTARGILEDLEQLHRDLAAYYQRRAETVGDERTQMLLGYLVDREEEQATVLHRTVDDYDEDAILSTWETSAKQMDAVTALIKASEQLNQGSADDIVTTAHKIDQMLIDYYELLTRESRIDRLAALFDNLRQGQQQSTTQMQMSVDRFQDL